MADSYEFLKGHYDRIQSEQRARDMECGEDHVIGERPDDCFACLSEQRDALLSALLNYGEHKRGCASKWRAETGSSQIGPCDCGLDAAIASEGASSWHHHCREEERL